MKRDSMKQKNQFTNNNISAIAEEGVNEGEIESLNSSNKFVMSLPSATPLTASP